MRRLLAVLAMAIPVAGYFALPLTASADEPEAQGGPLSGLGGIATGALGQIGPTTTAPVEEAAQGAATLVEPAAAVVPESQPAEPAPRQQANPGANSIATGALGQIAPAASAPVEEIAAQAGIPVEPAAAVAPESTAAEPTPAQQANLASSIVASLPGVAEIVNAGRQGAASGVVSGPGALLNPGWSLNVEPAAEALTAMPVVTQVIENLPVTNGLPETALSAVSELAAREALELLAVPELTETTGELAGGLVATGIAAIHGLQDVPLPLVGPIAENGLIGPIVAGATDDVPDITNSVLQTAAGPLETADPALREVDEGASVRDLTTPIAEAVAPAGDPVPEPPSPVEPGAGVMAPRPPDVPAQPSTRAGGAIPGTQAVAAPALPANAEVPQPAPGAGTGEPVAAPAVTGGSGRPVTAAAGAMSERQIGHAGGQVARTTDGGFASVEPFAPAGALHAGASLRHQPRMATAMPVTQGSAPGYGGSTAAGAAILVALSSLGAAALLARRTYDCSGRLALWSPAPVVPPG